MRFAVAHFAYRCCRPRLVVSRREHTKKNTHKHSFCFKLWHTSMHAHTPKCDKHRGDCKSSSKHTHDANRLLISVFISVTRAHAAHRIAIFTLPSLFAREYACLFTALCVCVFFVGMCCACLLVGRWAKGGCEQHNHIISELSAMRREPAHVQTHTHTRN